MVRELVHHGYKVRACLRDATSWRGQDAIQCALAPRRRTGHSADPLPRYLETLPGVEIYEGCDLFIPGSYDEAFKGCVGVVSASARRRACRLC